MQFELANSILAGLALIGSIVAIVISVKAWHKNRAVYDLEFWPVRGDTIEKIREKIKDGNYAIVDVHQQGEFPHDSKTIILGKIKK